jgi:hypothetical protein
MVEELISDELMSDDIGSSELASELIVISELIADIEISELDAIIGASEALDIMSDELDITSLDIASDDIIPLELSCATAEPANVNANIAVDPASTDRKPTSLIELSL